MANGIRGFTIGRRNRPINSVEFTFTNGSKFSASRRYEVEYLRANIARVLRFIVAKTDPRRGNLRVRYSSYARLWVDGCFDRALARGCRVMRTKIKSPYEGAVYYVSFVNLLAISLANSMINAILIIVASPRCVGKLASLFSIFFERYLWIYVCCPVRKLSSVCRWFSL